MVDQERIDELLAMLARYVRILRQLADVPLDEYRADPRNFGSAERFLQLAIETTLSIGHHIIATSGFDQPTSYADVFRVLGKEGVLDVEFATALEPMARMRNRLVHHYEDVEPARVHELLRTHLGGWSWHLWDLETTVRLARLRRLAEVTQEGSAEPAAWTA